MLCSLPQSVRARIDGDISCRENIENIGLQKLVNDHARLDMNVRSFEKRRLRHHANGETTISQAMVWPESVSTAVTRCGP